MPLLPDGGGALTDPNADPFRTPTESGPVIPTYDRSSELKSFMYAVFRAGGSSFGGDGGGYSFPKNQWDQMATAAGLKGANQGDTNAQTYVAAYWMDRLYQQYKNWGLVAVAWKEGGGAAAAIVKQSRKEPSQVSMAEIQEFAPDSMGWVTQVTNWQTRAEQKGGIPDDYVPQPGGMYASGTHTTITGTGAVNLDVYADTANQLREEWLAEDKARTPSGAEMLFSQLETLSGVVTGGEGRKDWRHDAPEAVAGGEVQRLSSMTRAGQTGGEH